MCMQLLCVWHQCTMYYYVLRKSLCKQHQQHSICRGTAAMESAVDINIDIPVLLESLRRVEDGLAPVHVDHALGPQVELCKKGWYETVNICSTEFRGGGSCSNVLLVKVDAESRPRGKRRHQRNNNSSAGRPRWEAVGPLLAWRTRTRHVMPGENKQRPSRILHCLLCIKWAGHLCTREGIMNLLLLLPPSLHGKYALLRRADKGDSRERYGTRLKCEYDWAKNGTCAQVLLLTSPVEGPHPHGHLDLVGHLEGVSVLALVTAHWKWHYLTHTQDRLCG